MKIDVLDHGTVELIDKMGSDLTTVEAARVSFLKGATEMGERERRLIRYLAEHQHTCYDEETEVLAEKGWLPWRLVTDEDKLAAYNVETGEIHFEHPTHITQRYYEGEMYEVQHGGVDLLVTPEHRMVVSWSRTQEIRSFPQFEFFQAHEIKGRPVRYVKAGLYVGGKGVRPFAHPNIGSNEVAWAWLIGFFVGDGHPTNGRTIRFHLKKERKIDALKAICHALNADLRVGASDNYTISIDGLGTWFRDTCYQNGKKVLPWSIVMEMTVEQRIALLEGLRHSDGSIKRGTWWYFTNSEQLAHQVQALCLLTDLPAHLHKIGELYGVGILSRMRHPRLNDDGTTRDRWVYYRGMVYCATVSTGALVVRRNNIPVISGNSPFRHAMLMLRFKAPLFVARQLWKHVIGITPEFDLEDRFVGFGGGVKDSGWNEASGRYVELQDEFYIPEVWRAQSPSNKQGSAGEVADQTAAAEAYAAGLRHSYAAYRRLRELGAAKEQARVILPQSIYTQWIWTGSLQAFLHVVELRAKPDAQFETQQYGLALRTILQATFPVCLEKWEARGKHPA